MKPTLTPHHLIRTYLCSYTQYINTFFNTSNYQRRGTYLNDDAMLWLTAFTTSLYCVGGAFGALTGGKLSDIMGR